MKHFTKLISLLFFLLSSMVLCMAQTSRVTGIVTNKNGEPVNNATVIVKGTTIHTVTDREGYFVINVPDHRDILVVRFIGMTTVEAQVEPTMRIVMEQEDRLLKDIIVPGYGTARKGSTIIGSVSSVKSDKLELKPLANVMDAIQGKVAGVQSFTSSGEPGTTSSVYIRGVGTLNAGTTPLYVLDGAPAGSDILLIINPQDIESVNFLKDASATSIYGSRAANGVIYITTKRGRISQSATITASAMLGTSSLARDVGTPMNAQQLLDFQLEYGIISQATYDHHLENGHDTNWQSYFFKNNAPTRQVGINISGGGGRTIYFLSLGYINQQGTSIGSDFEKYNLRSNIETQAKDWLRMGINLGGSYDEQQFSNYTYQASNSLSGGIFGTLLRQPYFTPFDEDGNKLDFIEGINAYSPYFNISKYPRTSNTIQINGSLFFELTPADGLTLKSQGAIEGYDYRYMSRNYPSHPGTKGEGTVLEIFSRGVTFTITNTAEYKFSIDDDHNIILLAGQEAIKNKYQSFRSQTTGQTDDRLMLLSAGTEATFLGSASQSRSEYIFSSFFGRVDYNYDEKYFADFSIRTDGSSRFGENNKYATFLSGGLMWNLKKEQFLITDDVISVLRLKGSIGSSGNAEVGNYNHLALVGVDNYNANPGWGIASPGNPNLQWEKQIKTDLTAQIGFLNRYNLSLTYYTRKTKNMLLSVPMAYTTGFSSMNKNIGELTNSGMEIEADAKVVDAGGFGLDLYATFSYNRLKIDKLFYGLTEWPMYSYLTSYIVGEPLNFFMPKFVGIDPDDGLPMWNVPGEGDETTKQMSDDLYQNTGKPRYPPFSGGFGLNARYKGAYVTADFAWVAEKYIVNNDRYFTENPGGIGVSGYNQSTEIIGKTWAQPGDENKTYTMRTSMQFDDHLLENASFLRLKNLTIGYGLPKSLLDKTNFFKAAKVFIAARNLFTLTRYKGADPEINSNLTYGAYPNSRQFTFGMEIKF